LSCFCKLAHKDTSDKTCCAGNKDHVEDYSRGDESNNVDEGK
jgi:hypothetical protein